MYLVLFFLTLQVILGIITLLSNVYLPVASLHQTNSILLLSNLVIPKDSNKQLSELPSFIWSLVTVAIPFPFNSITISLPLATGFSSSTTVTVCVAVAILPEESSTVQVTVVTPIWKVSGALFVTEATLQSSFVISVPKSTAEAVHNPGSTPTIGLESIRIVGSVLSLKKTFWVAVDMFPDESLTVHVTIVFPAGKWQELLYYNSSWLLVKYSEKRLDC